VVLGHTPSVATLLPDLASFRPTFILAVPRVFEKVYNGAEQQASASPVKGRIFRAAARAAVAVTRRNPSSSTSPMSPVRSQPSAITSAVAASLRQ